MSKDDLWCDVCKDQWPLGHTHAPELNFIEKYEHRLFTNGGKQMEKSYSDEAKLALDQLRAMNLAPIAEVLQHIIARADSEIVQRIKWQTATSKELHQLKEEKTNGKV